MGIRVAKAEKKRAITGVIATFELSRGEYFSEKSIFLHGPQKWPCTKIQENVILCTIE